LFVCLTVVGITSIPASITVTVVSTAGVSTVSAIVSAKTVSASIGMPVVSGVEDSGVSLSLSLGVSLTLLAGISHSGLCGNRGGKEGMVESISVAISDAMSVSVGCSIGNRGGPSSDGTRNNFSCFMFNGMKMWRSGGQKIYTKTIRNCGWDNCGGC